MAQVWDKLACGDEATLAVPVSLRQYARAWWASHVAPGVLRVLEVGRGLE